MLRKGCVVVSAINESQNISRLEESVNKFWNGESLFFQSKTLSMTNNPYSYIPAAIDEVARQGYRYILWISPDYYITKDLTPLFERLITKGHILIQTPDSDKKYRRIDTSLMGISCNQYLSVKYFDLFDQKLRDNESISLNEAATKVYHKVNREIHPALIYLSPPQGYILPDLNGEQLLTHI